MAKWTIQKGWFLIAFQNRKYTVLKQFCYANNLGLINDFLHF